MTFPRRFSLSARLLSSFGVVIVLMLALGAFSITELRSENSHVSRLASRTVPAVSLVGQAVALMNKYRKDELHYILSTPAERAGAQGIDGDLAGDLAGMAQVLGGYVKQGLVADAHDAQLLDSFKANFAAYVRESSRFKALADAAAGKDPETIKQKLQELISLGTELGTYYSSLEAAGC